MEENWLWEVIDSLKLTQPQGVEPVQVQRLPKAWIKGSAYKYKGYDWSRVCVCGVFLPGS